MTPRKICGPCSSRFPLWQPGSHTTTIHQTIPLSSPHLQLLSTHKMCIKYNHISTIVRSRSRRGAYWDHTLVISWEAWSVTGIYFLVTWRGDQGRLCKCGLHKSISVVFESQGAQSLEIWILEPLKFILSYIYFGSWKLIQYSVLKA